jgi:hypothetical protein
LRKSNVLSTRKGERWCVERVVREAAVLGGRVDGFGRRGEGEMVIRRWVERARGARSAVRRVMVEMCILVGGGCGGELDAGLCLEELE